MSGSLAIVWYRRDLRIEDHAGLAAACGRGGQALPLYIHDEREVGIGRWARPVGGGFTTRYRLFPLA